MEPVMTHPGESVGEPRTMAEMPVAALRERLLRILPRGPGAGVRQRTIAARLAISGEVAGMLLRGLKHEGLAYQAGGWWRGTRSSWWDGYKAAAQRARDIEAG
jgi:hypothetical protein